MGIWRSQDSVITNVGYDLLTKLSVQSKPLILTKSIAGSSAVADVAALKALTDLDLQKQVLQLGAFQYVTTGKASIEVLLENSQVSESYACSQIGLYARDIDDKTDILFAVMQAYEPDAIPTSTSPIIIRHKMLFTYGDVTSVEVSASFNGIASTDYVDEKVLTCEPKFEKGTAFNKNYGTNDSELAAPAINPFAGQLDNPCRVDHVHPVPSAIQYAENNWNPGKKTQLVPDTNKWTMEWAGTVNSSGDYGLDVTFDAAWNAYAYHMTAPELENLKGKVLDFGVETFVGATGRIEIVVNGAMATQLNSEILTTQYTVPADATSMDIRAIVFGTELNIKFTGLYLNDHNEQIDVSGGAIIYLQARKVQRSALPNVSTPGTIYITEDGSMYLGMDDKTLLPLAGSPALK